ncbi:MAG: PQQ-like beta-propeller repeat protein [Bryobacterales bacterium]|nr:PQQ-like beta-propeller repeat protein [Bryobacterales bacterium]
MVHRICAVLGLAAACWGQEWPQWRGAGRGGVAQGFVAPAAWPRELKMEWSAGVGGGFSTPAVSRDQVFVHSRVGDQEVVQALARGTGKEMWRAAYRAPFQQNQYATQMGHGPHSTPVFFEDKVITLGIKGMLVCHDAKTGAVKWKKDYSARVDSQNMFTGTAMSPLIEAGLVLVHIGDDRGGSLMAMDPATGAVKWSWDGDGPSYASPVVAEIGGVRQVVTLALKHAVGLDARNGALLWKSPFVDQWNENIVTPVVVGNRVVLSGVRKGTVALDVVRQGAGWTARTAWENAEYSMYMSSPVVDGDVLYGMTNKRKGSVFAMDVKTGKVLWSTPGREGTNLSLVAAGNVLFLLNETGDLKVIRRSAAKYDSVVEYKVSEEATWAQPVVLGKNLLVKDAKTVKMYRLP